MAGLTKGYPFAFQVLGYLTWNNGGDYNGILGEYEQYLSEFVYDKSGRSFLRRIAWLQRGLQMYKAENKRNQGCNWDGDKRIQSVS